MTTETPSPLAEPTGSTEVAPTAASSASTSSIPIPGKTADAMSTGESMNATVNGTRTTDAGESQESAAPTAESATESASALAATTLPAPYMAALEQAKAALRTEQHALAIERYAALAELMAKELGDSLHPALGSVWYGYGLALFGNAVAEANMRVLGGGVKDKEGDEEEGDVAVGDDENKGEDEGWEDVVDGDDEDGDAGDEENDAGAPPAEEESDFELAWEMLELARIIYSKDLPASRAQLANVHLAIGDLSLEEEKFEQAQEEYNAALLLRQQIHAAEESQGAAPTSSPSSSVRAIAELHYKMAVALELQRKFAKALEEMERAYALLKSRAEGLASVAARHEMERNDGSSTTDTKGKGKAQQHATPVSMTPAQLHAEISDLQSLLPDIAERMEELRAQIAEFGAEAPIDENIESLLSGLLAGGAGQGVAQAPAANDLSGLVKKKKKPVAVVNSGASASSNESTDMTATSTKRKAEEETADSVATASASTAEKKLKA